MAYLADGRPELARRSLQLALNDDPHFPDAASARSALDKASKERLAVKH
jgi:Tfp pilus assembly protein PilF